MRWNFKRELARKFIHMLSLGFLIIYFLAADFFNRQIALLVLFLLLIILLELEYLRIELGKKIPGLNYIWSYLRRGKERAHIGGDVYFLIGCILVLSVFDLKIAMIAVLMTVFGDLSAALIGKRFGRHYLKSLKNRAWEGIIAEFVVDFVIGFLVLFWGNFSPIYDLKLWIIILVMAVTATLVETIIYKMDDNLLIPVFSGFNGQMVLLLFEWLN